MVITGIVRFSYLINAWNFFEFLHHIYLMIFIAILAASDAGFGPANSERCRTYFNILDLHFGRGCFMIFINAIFLDRSDKGEELFCAICIVIGALNILAGYNEKIKKLPMKPWGGDDSDDEEKDLELGKKDKKKTKLEELNEQKKKDDKLKRIVANGERVSEPQDVKPSSESEEEEFEVRRQKSVASSEYDREEPSS